MVANVDVERLNGLDQLGLIDLFYAAFIEHPLIPALGAKLRRQELCLKPFLTIWEAPEAHCYMGFGKTVNLFVPQSHDMGYFEHRGYLGR